MEKSASRPDLILRMLLFAVAACILAFTYIFQRHGFLGWINVEQLHPYAVFALNRAIRLVLNDAACILLIYVFFRSATYLRLAFWVFLIELFMVLPAYLAVKLSLEGDAEISSPLLSHIHRLIVNPTLMLLLIAGFFYQKYFNARRGNGRN